MRKICVSWSLKFLYMYNVNIFASGTGQLKKRAEFYGYLENSTQSLCREVWDICSMAKGNLDAEEVVA